jgi:hypothetical protein
VGSINVGNDRPVVLLYLLLPQSQIRNKGNIKILFYGHGLCQKFEGSPRPFAYLHADENLLTDSEGNINSISRFGDNLPRWCPSKEQPHTQDIRSKRKGKDFFGLDQDGGPVKAEIPKPFRFLNNGTGLL